MKELDENMGGLLNSERFTAVFYILEADLTKTVVSMLNAIYLSIFCLILTFM